MDQIEKISTSVELTIDQVKLLVETIEFMFLQAAYHLIKPAALENDLMNEQNFDETKVRKKKRNFSDTTLNEVFRRKYSSNTGHYEQKKSWNVWKVHRLQHIR